MKPYTLLPWQRQAIAMAVAAGEKATAVAAEFGVSVQYAGQLAVNIGNMARRRPGRPKLKKLQKAC